jgi:hypothetical protein
LDAEYKEVIDAWQDSNMEIFNYEIEIQVKLND